MTIRDKLRQRLNYLKKIGEQAKTEDNQPLMLDVVIRMNEVERLLKLL